MACNFYTNNEYIFIIVNKMTKAIPQSFINVLYYNTFLEAVLLIFYLFLLKVVAAKFNKVYFLMWLKEVSSISDEFNTGHILKKA